MLIFDRIIQINCMKIKEVTECPELSDLALFFVLIAKCILWVCAFFFLLLPIVCGTKYQGVPKAKSSSKTGRTLPGRPPFLYYPGVTRFWSSF